MGVRVTVNTDFEELNDMWERDEGAPLPVAGWVAGKFVGGLARIAVYGFLLARPGVPFLPNGNTGALWITVVAALLTSLPLHKIRSEYSLALGGVCVVALALVLRMDAPTTSIVLIGTLVHSVARAADNYPVVYGIIAGGALASVAVQVFNLELFHPKQLLLSNEAFTPDRAGHQGLLLTAMLALEGLMEVGRMEMKRFRARAKEAEAARDTAVADERARIARELHDVVSHHVTAMTLQAEAAAMTGDKDALASVATAGREALVELRRMLGVLRRPSDDDVAELEPQPGLAELDRLAERTTAGLRVSVDKRGDVRALPAGLELCIYRLVQEALTNAAKHGDATDVEVVLDYGADTIDVSIRDNGRPLSVPRAGSGGLGLIGMSERVSLLDGELSTGPRADRNGYEVIARLPVEA